MTPTTEQKIREMAYMMWEAAGKPVGREMDFWLQAENQVKSELVRTGGKPAAKKPAAKKPAAKKPATEKPAAKAAPKKGA